MGDQIASLFSHIVLNDEEQVSPAPTVWKTLRNFTCFPDLPGEIRTLIWISCFPPPRRIHLSVGKLCRKKHSKKNKESKSHYHPLEDSWKTRLPTLRINRESRNTTLLHYRPIYRSSEYDYNTSKCVNTNLPVLFFCPNYDIITLAQDEFHGYAYWWAHNLAKLNPGCFKGVKLLQVREVPEDEPTYEIPSPSDGTTRLLALFPDLEELQLVHFGVPGYSIEDEDSSDTLDEAFDEESGTQDTGFKLYVDAMVEEGTIKRLPKINYIYDWYLI